MALQINTNPTAIFTSRMLGRQTSALNRNMERLSSALRINRAADDAAGLAIAESFRTQVNQYSQEVENLQYGVSAVQTAEGALSTQREGVQRLRELAVQASNGILNDSDRQALQAEANQIVSQLNETAGNTEFNGTTLLDGSVTEIDLGTEGQQRVNFNESTASALGVESIDLTTYEGAQAAIGQLDTAGNRIDQNRAALGAQQNRLEYAISQREIASENSAASESAIRDMDMAQGFIQQTQSQVLIQSGTSALAQSNVSSQMAARLLGG